LLGVLGQAVAPIPKTGVVVVVTNAAIQPYPFNDLAGVQTVHGSVGVQLVEVGHPHGQVGVGKQFDGLGLGAVGVEHGHVLFAGTFQQQIGKGGCPFGLLTHNDAAGVEVVV